MTIAKTAGMLAVGTAAEADAPSAPHAFPAAQFLFLVAALIALAFAIEAPIEDLTGHLRSEYRPIEILSGALVLAGFFASLEAALAAGTERKVASTAQVFAVLFAAVFLGETNALPGPVQPLVALPTIALLLWRKRRKKRVLAILAAAIVLFGSGFFADAVDDLLRGAKSGAAVPVPDWLEAFSRGEEIYEICAEAFLLWAALGSLWSQLGSLFAGRRAEMIGCAAALLCLGAGNGLLQAGYEPSSALRLAGFALAASGLAVFLACARRIARCRLALEHALLLYAFLVVIPSVAGKIPEHVSAAVWLPVLGAGIFRAFGRGSGESGRS